MAIEPLVFYMFATILVLSGVMVVFSQNPVHSVLFLILAFFQSAGLFLLMGAEFIALMLVIVYVGAVAVLFLFVVMMLDINFEGLRRGVLAYLPIGGLVGLVLLTELLLLVGAWQTAPDAMNRIRAPVPADETVTNAHALGRILYTDFLYLFQGAGIILLIAMVGAIVLTLRSRKGVRRQDIPTQLARRPQDVVMVRKVPTRGGV